MSVLEYLRASAFSDWPSMPMAGFPALIALHSAGMAVVVGLTLTVTMRVYELAAVIAGRLIAYLSELYR